jgi:hypothetical protein
MLCERHKSRRAFWIGLHTWRDPAKHLFQLSIPYLTMAYFSDHGKTALLGIMKWDKFKL